MYLRQSNKWNEFLLAEAIENIGLPPRVVTWIRRRAAFTADGDANAQKLADQQGVELQKIDEKHLTWLGQLLKSFDMRLFTVTDARQLTNFIKKALSACKNMQLVWRRIIQLPWRLTPLQYPVQQQPDW